MKAATEKTKSPARKKASTPKAAKAVETVLVVRTCDKNMCSYGRFVWPQSGPVECTDWKPTGRCGNGLHGWLWGEGDGSLGNWDGDAKWLVVEVAAADVIDLGGKVKFPRGIVVHCGDRLSATDYIRNHGGIGKVVIGGTATAGYGGTATAGYRGTATAGDRGTATAGDRGTATAGDGGIICIRYWDGSADRYRLAIGNVGEDGIKAGAKYRVKNGKLIEVR